MLNALGLTIWGPIALGLLATFVFVGYEAALRMRPPGRPLADSQGTNGRAQEGAALTRPEGDTVTRATPVPSIAAAASKPVAMQETRAHFLDAAEKREFGPTLEYGERLFEEGHAGPDDLVIIAHAFYSLRDCDNALTWVDRAGAAFQAAGRAPDDSLRRMRVRCSVDSQPAQEITEACKAFAKLEDLPHMSPRMLKLWKLFADTHC